MATEARIRELGLKHEQVEALIRAELRRPGDHSLSLAALKRKKLKLKEEMEALRQHAS